MAECTSRLTECSLVTERSWGLAFHEALVEASPTAQVLVDAYPELFGGETP